jgi:RNA-binding protein
LKLIGRPSFYTNEGNLVVKSKEVPPIYSPVVTRDSKRVGKIHDVIGPVSHPYVIIKPEIKGFKTKKELFITFQKRKRRKSGGKSRTGGKKG